MYKFHRACQSYSCSREIIASRRHCFAFDSFFQNIFFQQYSDSTRPRFTWATKTAYQLNSKAEQDRLCFNHFWRRVIHTCFCLLLLFRTACQQIKMSISACFSALVDVLQISPQLKKSFLSVSSPAVEPFLYHRFIFSALDNLSPHFLCSSVKCRPAWHFPRTCSESSKDCWLRAEPTPSQLGQTRTTTKW